MQAGGSIAPFVEGMTTSHSPYDGLPFLAAFAAGWKKDSIAGRQVPLRGLKGFSGGGGLDYAVRPISPDSVRPGKANSEPLDQAGDAAHVHIKVVLRPKRREPLRIGGPAQQLRP